MNDISFSRRTRFLGVSFLKTKLFVLCTLWSSSSAFVVLLSIDSLLLNAYFMKLIISSKNAHTCVLNAFSTLYTTYTSAIKSHELHIINNSFFLICGPSVKQLKYTDLFRVD
jgi:hypothetical protein